MKTKQTGLWAVITCPKGDPIHRFFGEESAARECAAKSLSAIVEFWAESTLPPGVRRNYGYLMKGER